MPRIYLIRHAKPDLPPGPRLCYGTTDIPLGPVGRMQGVLLAEYMKDKPFTQVFCSNLSRSRQTAEYLSPNPTEIPGLREMYAGEWENLTFDIIRERWPGEYEKRGQDPTIPIPGGETAQEAQTRFYAAMVEAVAGSRGDIAVVGHASVMRTFLCKVLGQPLQRMWDIFPPYGSVMELSWDGQFHLETEAHAPRPRLTPELCQKLLEAAGTPGQVIDHCRTVAHTALELAKDLPVNRELLESAAWLHDIARTHPDHPNVGAGWLKELGYPEIGAIIAGHHDPANGEINEETLLFLADKFPVEERFAKSREKCTTPEAQAAHARRYKLALELKEKINGICGKDVVI